MPTPLPAFVAGVASGRGETVPVHSKHTGEPVGAVVRVGAPEVERAIAAAHDARRACAATPSHRRRDALAGIERRLRDDAEPFARLLVHDVGKTIREARVEVARAADTFRLAAEESTRIRGEHAALDIAPRHDGVQAVWKRVPVGVVSMISPFNFPLNLAAHKIGPAIAAGCPFVLKPSPRAPLSAYALAGLLAEAGLPEGSWSVLLCDDRAADALVADERIAMLSFTGSPAVGWALKARAGKKRVALELGGVACCIVDETADPERAADRIAAGAFGTAGQSCISVQRVLAHPRVFEALVGRVARRASALRLGDPMDESTDVGPMIDPRDAERAEAWVAEAIAAGATVRAGGRRAGGAFPPTVLTGVPASARLACEEVFAPVVSVEPYADFAGALRTVNAGRFGLQAGLFTRDLPRALAAWDRLEVGGVIVNDIPTTRVDSMPYGGVKDSGFGREGVRFAVEEMTELRTLVLVQPVGTPLDG